MRIIGIEVVEKPAVLPVTVQEFVDHARLNGITVGREPDLITRELAAAVSRAERYLRRSLISQTLKGYYAQDYAACDATLHLPRGKVWSVVSVHSGSDPLDPADYRLEGNIVYLAAMPYGSATCVWVSGYGDAADDVPDHVREGILEYATQLYCDRLGVREAKYAAGAGNALPLGIQDLWRPEQIELSG